MRTLKCALRRNTNRLALVHNDDAALDYDFRFQQVPVAVERIAGEEDHVSQLTSLQRPKVLALLNEGGGVGPHELDDVLHRKHQIEGAQFMREARLRLI